MAVYSVLPLDPLMRDEGSQLTPGAEMTPLVGPAGTGKEGVADPAQGGGPERPLVGREAETELIISQVSRLIRPRSGGHYGTGGTIFIEGNTGDWIQ